MIICKNCLEKDYLNKVNDGDLLPNICEICLEEKKCAILPEDRIIKKNIYEEIVEKKQRKPRTKKEDKIPLTPAEEIPHTELSIVVPDINAELAKHNVTESILAEIEATSLSLTINGIEDKTGYEAVNKLRIACKNLRVLGTKICKDARAGAIKYQKECIAKEDELETRIKKTEDECAAKQKIIDDEKDKIKQERELKEQALLHERSTKLINLGMVFEKDAYVLDDIKISVTQIKNLDDFVFGSLFVGVEKKFKENQEIKAQEDLIKAEQETTLKKQAEEQLAKEEELKKKEEEITVREQAIKNAEIKAKEAAEARILAEEIAAKQKAQNEIVAREKATQDILKARKSSLFQLGMAQQADKLIFQDFMITESQLMQVPEDKWSDGLIKITQRITEIKTRLEKERIEKETKLQEEAATKERLRIEAEQIEKTRKENEAKEIAEKEKQRVAALAPDSQKLDDYLKSLYSIVIPEFSTPEYILIGNYTKEALINLIKHVSNKKPK